MDNYFYKMPETSQSLEMSRILEEHLGQKLNGVYVEIGANDGFTFGITGGLAQMGWKGYCVEPYFLAADMCRDIHKNNDVEVFEYLISDKVETVDFFISKHMNGAVSTTKDITQFKDAVKYYDKVTMDTITMDMFIEEIGNPKIDLLVIDTEGTEDKVLEGYKTIKNNPPKIVFIEYNYNKEYLEKIANILGSDYLFVYLDQYNAAFVYIPEFDQTM